MATATTMAMALAMAMAVGMATAVSGGPLMRLYVPAIWLGTEIPYLCLRILKIQTSIKKQNRS